MSRIPVCPACLTLPQPLTAEFFCRSCLTPFVDEFPLDEHDLCTVCRQGTVNFDVTYSFGSFEGPLQQLVHLFKYGKVETLAAPLSQMMWRAVATAQIRVDAVEAMPMHWRKQWDRGFNQAELLAQPLARRLGVPLTRHLKRKRYTKSQAGLSERERRENLKDSFTVSQPAAMNGRRILLVDDVFTTGSTLRAAAKVLKEAGASRVEVATLARVDRRSGGVETLGTPRAA